MYVVLIKTMLSFTAYNALEIQSVHELNQTFAIPKPQMSALDGNSASIVV